MKNLIIKSVICTSLLLPSVLMAAENAKHYDDTETFKVVRISSDEHNSEGEVDIEEIAKNEPWVVLQYQASPFYDPYLQHQADINSEFIGFEFGKVSFDKLIHEMDFDKSKITSIFGIEARFTATPIFSEDYIRDLTYENIDAENPDTTSERREQIAQFYQDHIGTLAQDPNSPLFGITGEEARVIIHELSNQAVENITIDFAQSYKDEIDERIKDGAKDLVIQNIVVRFSHAFGKNKSAFAFLRVGKITTPGAGDQDIDHNTKIGRIRPRRTKTQYAMSAVGTSGAQVGILKKIDDETWVRAEFFSFHDHDPFVSAYEYIGNVLAMPDEEYEDYYDYEDIDSKMFRLLFNSKYLELHGAVGDYDGNEAYALGGVFKLPQTGTELHVDYYDGNRSILDRGQSVFLSQDIHVNKIFPWLNGKIYMGQEKLRGSRERHFDFQNDLDSTEKVFGFSLGVEFSFLRDFKVEPSLRVEHFSRQFHNDDTTIENNEMEGWRAGFQFRACYSN